MNKNKLIFAIIGGVVLVLIALGAMMLGASNDTKKVATKDSAEGSFKIWIVGDSKANFETFLSGFKEVNKNLSQLDFEVVSFDNFEEYNQSLTTAFIKGEAPDVFVLDNNETSLFEEKIIPLGKDVVDINEFRKNYKIVFSEDLIVTTGEEEDEDVEEYLKAFPAGYETLSVFYNRGSGFKGPDFQSQSALDSAIERIGNIKLTPMGIGNGSTVVDAGDIVAQFFLLNKSTSLEESAEGAVIKALGSYTKYGNVSGSNAYNTLYDESIAEEKNNIELLRKGDVGAVIAYPRQLQGLEGTSSLKNLLFAAPFPHSYSGDGKSLARYQAFAISSETEQYEAAVLFIQYLNSDEGMLSYLDTYKYYLPARVNLEEELRDKRVSGYFSGIVRGDLYSIEPLSSFNKGNRVIYDKGIQAVLDDFSSYQGGFEKFRTAIVCKSNKILNLENLGKSCE